MNGNGQAMITQSEIVDTYIAGVPIERQEALNTLRQWILGLSMDIIENLDYGMPTYHIGTRYCSFAYTRNYVAIYMDANLVNQHRKEFPGLNIEKNCIRFHEISELPKSTLLMVLTKALLV